MTLLSHLIEHTRTSDMLLRNVDALPWTDVHDRMLPVAIQETAWAEIRRWPAYTPTPLIELPDVASALGLGSVLYKDESQRLGLGSFKALGGAYAVLHHVAELMAAESSADPDIAHRLQQVRTGEFATQAGQLTVTTATDGNHGRSVAWGAQQAGCQCQIYIHREVSEGRAAAMAEFGATVTRIDGDYDDSLKCCSDDAEANGWHIISDTSWDGYHEVPTRIMAGYGLMVDEILNQQEQLPTHVILQAGVGGLAAAVCAAFWSRLGEKAPRFIVTESEHAACVLESLRRNAPSIVSIEQETLMAGLSCGEISQLAWPILSKCVSASCTLPDSLVAPAMQYMASREPRIESGECGVPGLLTGIALARDATARTHLQLDEDSRLLVFGCEGATDPVVYDRLLAEPLPA